MVGKRPELANCRLWLMGERLKTAKSFIERDKIKAASAVENRTHKRCDGEPCPNYSAQGESAPKLADMIVKLKLMCEQGCKGCVER